MDDLPDGQVLTLTQDNMAMIQRFIDMNVGEMFGKAALFNTKPVDYPSFILVSDPKAEQGSSPQRTFHLRAVVHHESDLWHLCEAIRRREFQAAVRVIRLQPNGLRHAFQYDPLAGTANKDIPISA